MTLLIKSLSLVARYSQWNSSTFFHFGVFRRQLAVTVDAELEFKQGNENKSAVRGPPM